MSSTAQTAANQQNAAHSTGPSSPQGKAASSRNATTHGLSGHFAVLPHEDLAVFERMLAGYVDTFAPRNDHEYFLVSRMVESRWKLRRLQRMEAALVLQMTGQDTNHTDPNAVIAAAMLAGNANAYASLQRYSAAAERSYYKAKQELERERARDAKPAAKPETRPVQNEPNSVGSPSSNVLDGLQPDTTLDYMEKLAASWNRPRTSSSPATSPDANSVPLAA
jgi:hypothetical protein